MVVQVNLDISESRHSHQHAQEALAYDPAGRLGIRIRGKDAQGEAFKY